MTSKIIVNQIEADAGITSVTFNDTISGNLEGNVNATGISTFNVITGVSTIGVTTIHVTGINDLSYPTSGPLGRRNFVINGGMTVAQRSTSESGIGITVAYNTVDRWRFADSQNPSARFTQSQSTDAPDGFSNSHKFEVTTTTTSVTADQMQYTDQFIEAQNLQHLAYGTSNAKKITLSFWVKSSVAQTFGVGLSHEDGGGSYGVSYTLNSADTWEYKTLTFNGNGSTAINNDNGRGLRVRFGLSAGSNNVNGSDATSWTGAVFGQHDNGWLATSGATWQITGVQLEVGSNATDFEHRSYGEELQLCKRYYQKFDAGRFRGLNAYPNVSLSSGDQLPTFLFPVQFRTTPTMTPTTATATYDKWNATGSATRELRYTASSGHVQFQYNSTDGSNQGNLTVDYFRMRIDDNLEFSAEL